MIPILTAASIRASARGPRQPALAHPVMLGLSLDPSADISAPATLLESCVEVRPIINPLLDELASRAGLTRSGARSFKGSLKSLEPVALERFFRSLPLRSVIGAKAFASVERSNLSGIKRPSAAKELRELFASRPEFETLADLDFGARARAATGVFILVRLKGTLSIDFITQGFSEGLDYDLDLFSPKAAPPLLVRPLEALELARSASVSGMSLVDFGRPARVRELESLLDSSLLLFSTPGSPSLIQAKAGEGTGLSSLTLEPIGAMSLVGRSHLSTPVAVEPMVVEMADMGLAAGTGRRGLQSYQDHFVSLYLASEHGAICAFDPGLGKTVAAVSALEEASRPGYLALAAVPSPIKSQWEAETRKWAPSLTPRVLSSAQEITEMLATGASEPSLLIISHDLLGRNAELVAKFSFDDFIIDEARFVSAASVRLNAFRLVRASSRRALALTGTPAERDLSEIAFLASLVRSDDSLTVGVKKGSYDPARLGPILFRRSKAELEGSLPKVQLHSATLEPSDAEKVLFDALVRELKTRAELLRTARRAGEGAKLASLRSSLQAGINLLRAAVSDPTNLLRSNAPFARTLVDQGLVAPAAARSSRRLYAANLAQEVTNRGQVLVCSDFVASCEALSEHAASLGLRSAALTGNVDPVERTMLCASFAAGDLDLLAVSASAQRGVNLQTASALVHLDLPLTGAMLVQRTGRVVRLGSSRRHVDVHLPLYEDSVDSLLSSDLAPVLTSLDSGLASAEVSVITDEASMLSFVDRL